MEDPGARERRPEDASSEERGRLWITAVVVFVSFAVVTATEDGDLLRSDRRVETPCPGRCDLRSNVFDL